MNPTVYEVKVRVVTMAWDRDIVTQALSFKRAAAFYQLVLRVGLYSVLP